MIRNLKALGLALVAVFALSAMVASAASAAEGVITSETGEDVTLTATDTGEPENNRLTVGENWVQCPDSSYTGHAVRTHAETTENEEHKFLTSGVDDEVTVTPHYKQTVGGPGTTPNCDATGGFSATVTMNGCDYRFHDFTTDESGKAYDFLADLVCPPETHVDVHVYAGHGHSFEVCHDEITPGTNFSGGKATNGAGSGEVEHHINLTGTVTGFTVHQSGLCGSATTEGEYDLDVTVWGHNELLEDIGVTLSHA